MAMIKFLKPKNKLENSDKSTFSRIHQDEQETEEKCPKCRKSTPISILWSNNKVCSCGHHFRMGARARIKMIADEGSFIELMKNMKSDDPLKFPGYMEKLNTVQLASGEEEGVICGVCEVSDIKTCIFVMEPNFMMGSMGSVVGEKITSLFEFALKNRLSVLGFTVSGGARMQEGLVSLMQMAKTSAAVKQHSDANLLYIAVLTDPTTGGVTASFAMEADIILSEPDATIGFAGARVIEQTTRKSLPKRFQKAEFVMEHGFVDKIIERNAQKSMLGQILKMHKQ